MREDSLANIPCATRPIRRRRRESTVHASKRRCGTEGWKRNKEDWRGSRRGWRLARRRRNMHCILLVARIATMHRTHSTFYGRRNCDAPLRKDSLIRLHRLPNVPPRKRFSSGGGRRIGMVLVLASSRGAWHPCQLPTTMLRFGTEDICPHRSNLVGEMISYAT